jgi:DNA-binding NtrC family response regulator
LHLLNRMFPKKTLVVDDDKLIGWALQRELSSLDIFARVAETAADALAEVRRDFYDLIFLDIHLPDGDGIELLGEIDRMSPGSTVVIMSADASLAIRRRAEGGGAYRFLEKPFELSEIHGVLMSVSEERPRQRRHGS